MSDRNNMSDFFEDARTEQGYKVVNVEGGGCVCSNCGKHSYKMARCSRCKVATYCSRECQTAQWKAHKVACKKLTMQLKKEELAAAAAAAEGGGAAAVASRRPTGAIATSPWSRAG